MFIAFAGMINGNFAITSCAIRVGHDGFIDIAKIILFNTSTALLRPDLGFLTFITACCVSLNQISLHNRHGTHTTHITIPIIVNKLGKCNTNLRHPATQSFNFCQ